MSAWASDWHVTDHVGDSRVGIALKGDECSIGSLHMTIEQLASGGLHIATVTVAGSVETICNRRGRYKVD